MKKLSLVMAVALALPALAHADVTVYGTLAAGVQSYNNGNQTQTLVDDFGSKIGFKGNEDLGNGLKTIWQVESSFDADGTTAGTTNLLAGRQTFIGLQSESLGTLKIGRLWDVMVRTEETDQFLATRNDPANLTFPIYEDGYLPGFSLGSGTDSGSGAKNSITYDMPTWNGLDFGLQYTAGENKTTSQGATDRWGARVEYAHPATNLFIGAAYEAALNQTTTGDTGSISRVEAGYRGDALNIAFTYNHASLYGDNTVASSALNKWVSLLGVAARTDSHLTVNSYATRVAYNIGSFTPSFEYSHIQDATVDGKSYKTATNQYGFAVDYHVSKHTTATAGYLWASQGQDLQQLNGTTSNPHALYTGLLVQF